MPARSFDVVILGGGNAGMGVTVATREAGLTVAMLEPDLLGGTCPNRGCMPKKVLVAAAQALDEIERDKAHHIHVGKPSLDWAALIDREQAMISGIPASVEELMNRRGVEVIRDHGRFATQRRGCWRRNTQSEAHRDRHRLDAAPTAVSRRRADDHLGRCVERARCRGCSITWMRTLSRNCAARPNGSGLRSRPGRASADRADSGPAPRRLSRGRIGTHSRGRAGGQRSGTSRECRRPRPCRR